MHQRAGLTGGLHFPHRRLILSAPSGAKAPPDDRRPTQGIRSLRYLFEEYAFDTDRRELYRGADVVSVAPQAFDLLEYLIRTGSTSLAKTTLLTPSGTGVSYPMPR